MKVVFNIGTKPGSVSQSDFCREASQLEKINRFLSKLETFAPGVISGFSYDLRDGVYQNSLERTAVITVVFSDVGTNLASSQLFELVASWAEQTAYFACKTYGQECIAWEASSDEVSQGGLEYNPEIDDTEHLEFDSSYFLR